MSRYPLVPLRELLERSIDEVPVEREAIYPIAGVYSFGRGLFARTPIVGADTKYAKLRRLHSGQLVMSRLNGWEGALAIVDATHDGMFVSQEFPTFAVRPDVSASGFVRLLSQWPGLWDGLLRSARGIGAQTGARRLRVNADRLLATEVPLPPLDEQARIVTLVDRVGRHASRASALAETSEMMISTAWWGTLRRRFEGLAEAYGTRSLEDVVALNPDSIDPAFEFGTQKFKYIDISAITNGTGRIDAPKTMSGAAAPSRARRRIRTGDVLVSTVRPNLRGTAQVMPDLDGQVASTGFAVLRPSTAILSEFLVYQMLSDFAIEQLVGEARGGHYPAVNDLRLRRVQLVAPPTRVQLETASVFRRLHERVNRILPLMQTRRPGIATIVPAVLDAELLR
jgi:hypothetical protein